MVNSLVFFGLMTSAFSMSWAAETPQLDPHLTHSCVQKICGAPQTNLTPHDLFRKKVLANPSLVTNWKNQYQPFLQKALDWEWSAEQVALKRKAQSLEKFDQLLVESPLKPLLVIVFLSEKVRPHAEKLFIVSADGISVNEQVLQNIFPDSESKRSALKIFFENMILPDVLNLEIPFSDILRLSYPSLDLVEAQKTFVSPFLQKFDELKKTVPSSIFDIYYTQSDRQLLLTAVGGGNLSQLDSQRLMDLLTRIKAYSGFFTKGELRTALLKVNLQDFKGMNREALTKELKAGNRAERSRRAMGSCQYSVLSAASMDLSNEKQIHLRNMIDETKKVALELISHYVNSEELEIARTKIKNVQFGLPLSGAEQIEGLRQDVKSQQESDARLFEYMQNRQDLLSDQLALVFSSPEEDEDSKVDEACQRLEGYELTDHALGSLGRISVSGYSIERPEIGIGVLAHEMGHVISSLVEEQPTGATQRYRESRMCVSNRNPFLKKEISLESYQEGPWTEEDWADYYSSKILNRLKQTSSSVYSETNFACAFFSKKEDQYIVDGLAPMEGDSHSSDFLRLLQIAHDRNLLPGSCASFLNQQTRCE